MTGLARPYLRHKGESFTSTEVNLPDTPAISDPRTPDIRAIGVVHGGRMVGSSTKMSAKEKRIRILLMERNPVLLEGIASLLRDEPDIELVGSAMSVLAGVDLFRQVQPNVILLDLELAGATSAMTVRELRGVDSDTSIIVLASYELDPAATSVIQAGATAVVAKHQLENSLLNVIRTTRAGQTNT